MKYLLLALVILAGCGKKCPDGRDPGAGASLCALCDPDPGPDENGCYPECDCFSPVDMAVPLDLNQRGD